jgi:hypothetical protein
MPSAELTVTAPQIADWPMDSSLDLKHSQVWSVRNESGLQPHAHLPDVPEELWVDSSIVIDIHDWSVTVMMRRVSDESPHEESCSILAYPKKVSRSTSTALSAAFHCATPSHLHDDSRSVQS